MSHSALLSLAGPVHPQTPSGPVVGQGRNVLTGESVLGQNADNFTGLLAKASEGDGAAVTAEDLFCGTLTAGGDLPALGLNLIKDENGESAVAGLAGELTLSTVSHVSLSAMVTGVDAAPQRNDGTLLAEGGEKTAKVPFVALPQPTQGVDGQPALTEKTVGADVDQVVANVQNTAPALGVSETAAFNAVENAAANPGVLKQTERFGQVSPQVNDERGTAQTGPVVQVAGSVSTTLPSTENFRNPSDLRQGAAPELPDAVAKQSSPSAIELNAPELPKPDQDAHVFRVLAARSSKTPEQPRNSAPSSQVKPANNVVKAEQVANAVGNRVVTASKSESVDATVNLVNAPGGKVGASAGDMIDADVRSSQSVAKRQISELAAAPEVKSVKVQSGPVQPQAAKVKGGVQSDRGDVPVLAGDVIDADVRSSQSAAKRQISELAAAPEVKSVKVQSGPVQPQAAEVKGGVQSGSGDVFVDAVGGGAEASLVKPVLVRQTEQTVSGFVGNQHRAVQSASVESDGDIIFPNVTSKPDVLAKANSQISQVQKVVDVVSVQGGEADTRSAEQVSRSGVVTAAAVRLVGKDKTAGGAGQVTVSSEAVGEAGDAAGGDELTNVLRKSAEHATSADKKNIVPSVSIQAKVPRANEQVASKTTFDWGLAAGPLSGADAEFDWENSEGGTSAAMRSDTAVRSTGSLSTSTLRNVANAVWPEIARQASGGVDRFEIRLDPKDLGGVDVSLEFSKDGRVRAHLIVERPETLDFLQRDQRGLEKALQEAGVESDKSSLQFSLGGRGSQSSDQQDNRQANVAQLDRAADGAGLPEENYLSHNKLNNAARASGLDISV